MNFTSHALSHPGLRRESNEDSYCLRPGLGLSVVADGMGGHAAGEVASRVAVDAIEAFIQQTEGADEFFTWPMGYDPALSVDGNRLVGAFRLASRGIQQRAIDDPSLRGMATTAVAMLVDLGSGPVAAEDLPLQPEQSRRPPLGQPLGPKSTGRQNVPAAGNATVPMMMGVPRPDLRRSESDGQPDSQADGQPDSQADSQADSQQRGQSVSALVAHVGDSRAYLWREGLLEQVTRDHSWIEEQVAAGTLSAQDARTHPWRNLVTRALGGGEEPLVELTPLALQSGDRVLLCSDGLTTPLTDATIREVLSRKADQGLEALAQSLVEAANTAGGPDNITVVIVEAR